MKWVKRLGLVAVAIAVSSATWIGYLINASLPDLDGEITVAGLSSPVVIERDALGVATVRGETRLDVARALGFLHGQERFFQMDLMRRRAAGELAELVGTGALPLDRHHRLHRMRARAERRVETLGPTDRAPLVAYTEGVNSGLGALDARPFEYLLLRQDPQPWSIEDSVLVIASMFFELNDEVGRYESMLGVLHDVLPPELADFLSPLGTDWDAPVTGGILSTPPVPKSSRSLETRPVSESEAVADTLTLGSNNWAVAGERTAHGGALLASDMHLGHAVPNIWYRAVLSSGAHLAVGVTLPGAPFLVAGSNTHIAWAFTNSNGDWVDLVEIETHPSRPLTHRTPTGWEPYDVHHETLRVAGGDPETMTVLETRWGPIVDDDHQGNPRAVRWIAHDVEGIDVTLRELETVTSLDEALGIAQRSGIPPQNFVCVDRAGEIAWTIAGRIPRRFGFDGRLPTSWADGTRGWSGWLDPEDYPVVRNPENGVLWTANARVVDGAMLETLGDGNYDLGARARQIRDALLDIEEATERDMLGVQLDDRAVFMTTWRDLLVEWIDDEDVRRIVEEDWTGRASIDSAGYRAVRELRLAIYGEVLSTITAEARGADESFNIWVPRQWEGPLWKLVNEKPEDLVPREYETWDAWMKDIIDRTVAEWDEPFEARTWGAARMSAIRHPLSRSVPFLSPWLDMPSRPLPGDSHMPRVQSRSHGASERLVVSPGREDEGLFHMPAGQSGHPLSPYYGAGHEAWEEGRPTPLLPGETVYTLILQPH